MVVCMCAYVETKIEARDIYVLRKLRDNRVVDTRYCRVYSSQACAQWVEALFGFLNLCKRLFLEVGD